MADDENTDKSSGRFTFTRRAAAVSVISLLIITAAAVVLWPEDDTPRGMLPTPRAIPAGTITSESGGGRVFGATAFDATTLQLQDGKRVRLLGIVAPLAGSCNADEAVKHTREMLRSPVLELTYPGGAGADEFGQRWVYARYGYEGAGARLRDMGLELAAKGWVAPMPVSPDPPEYEAKILNNVQFAKANLWGRSDVDSIWDCGDLRAKPIAPIKMPEIKIPELKLKKLDDN